MPTYPPNTLPRPSPIAERITYIRPLVEVGEALLSYQQFINADLEADGTLPTGTPTWEFGTLKWPAQDAGGFFDFGTLEPVCVFLECDFGLGHQGSSIDVTISVVNMDNANAVIAAETVVIFAGNVGNYISTDPIRLTGRQSISITTSGSIGNGCPLILRAKAMLQRHFQG